MSRWASGITVVTCRHENRVHGMTASAFCSISLEPALVMVSVGKNRLTHELIERDGVFGIHILDAGMKDLSDRCAGFRGEEGHWLDDLPHRTETTDAPILAGALGWVDCRLWKAVDGGDHTLFLGEVQAAGSREGQPLLWFERDYHTLAE